MSDDGVRLRCRIRAYDPDVAEFEIFTDGLATLNVNAIATPPILDIPPGDTSLSLEGGSINMAQYNSGGVATSWGFDGGEESWMSIDNAGLFTWTNEIAAGENGAVTITATNTDGADDSTLNWVAEAGDGFGADWLIEYSGISDRHGYFIEQYGDLTPANTITVLISFDEYFVNIEDSDWLDTTGTFRYARLFGDDWRFESVAGNQWATGDFDLGAAIVAASGGPPVPVIIWDVNVVPGEGNPPEWLPIDDVTIFQSDADTYERDMNEFVVSETDITAWTTNNGNITQPPAGGIWTPGTTNPGVITSYQTATNEFGTTQGDEWDLIILPSGGTLNISWVPPTERADGSTLVPIDTYLIEYEELGDALDSLIVPGSETSVTLTDLNSGEIYRVRISCTDTDGKTSQLSGFVYGVAS